MAPTFYQLLCTVDADYRYINNFAVGYMERVGHPHNDYERNNPATNHRQCGTKAIVHANVPQINKTKSDKKGTLVQNPPSPPHNAVVPPWIGISAKRYLTRYEVRFEILGFPLPIPENQRRT